MKGNIYDEKWKRKKKKKPEKPGETGWGNVSFTVPSQLPRPPTMLLPTHNTASVAHGMGTIAVVYKRYTLS